MGNEATEQSEPVRECVEATQPDLTEDERTVLELGTTQPMIPIGRWEKPIKSLLARGFMVDAGEGVNAYTTPAGKKALDAAEDKVLGELIDKTREVESAHEVVRKCVEEAAQLMVKAVRISSRVTGGVSEGERREWFKILTARTKELLGG